LGRNVHASAERAVADKARVLAVAGKAPLPRLAHLACAPWTTILRRQRRACRGRWRVPSCMGRL